MVLVDRMAAVVGWLLSGGGGVGLASLVQLALDTNGNIADFCTSQTWTFGTQPASGDLLLALTVNVDWVCTPPSGFILNQTVPNQGGTSTVGIYTYTAEPGDSKSWTWAWSGTADYHGVVLLDVTGTAGIDKIAYNGNETAPTLANTNTSECTVNLFTQNNGTGLVAPGTPWAVVGEVNPAYHQIIVVANDNAGAGSSVTGGANGALTTVAISLLPGSLGIATLYGGSASTTATSTIYGGSASTTATDTI
jgi:hypothetical protein